MLKRIIARLDIKGPNLIKGIHLEGLRVLGDPHQFAVNYYQSGIDEIILMDSVASLYGRNQLSDVVRSIAKEVFVPITVGGGIRSELDVYDALKNGADKVAINTAIVENPGLISTIIKSSTNLFKSSTF
jgi:cyclase